MSITDTHTCPNCGTLAPERFCPSCGQDNRRSRLETRGILSDAVQNLVGWDSALGRTLKGLVLEPGRVAGEYVAGRRRRYVNPARFALLSLALWFVVTKLSGLSPMEVSGIRITNSSGTAPDFVAEIRGFLGRHLQLLLYLALPLRAFFFRLLFRGSDRNLAECLVLVLYVAGFGYLLGALTTPWIAFGMDWTSSVRVTLTVAWSIWGAHTFFERGWPSTLWRVLAVTALHGIGTILFFAAVAIPWALWTTG